MTNKSKICTPRQSYTGIICFDYQNDDKQMPSQNRRIRFSTLACISTCSIFGQSSALAETITVTLINGDVLRGERIEQDNAEDTIILIHPQLGKIVLKPSQIKTSTQPKVWTGSLSLGISGGNTGGDRSGNGTISSTWDYKKSKNELKLAGNWNYEFSRDAGESNISVDTNKATFLARYDRKLSQKLSAYVSTDYLMDAKNTVAVNDLTTSIGLGYELLKTKTSKLKVSIGPSLQWLSGGSECDSDPNCGNAYAASTFTTEFTWKPSKRFQLSLIEKLTGAYVNGVTPSSNFIASFKIVPHIDSKVFTTLNLQSMYQPLQQPKYDNSVSMQVGTEF
ncbi:MAG: hypothetical protein CL862_05610 [Cyanobium sp. NAT70]|nr:hypothetical protein [Cyanobium sp. NAT70]|tara:strand:+ start:2604 stop:3611 length:1008 start_codon:yes stop_codon:yes gene_type:complete